MCQDDEYNAKMLEYEKSLNLKENQRTSRTLDSDNNQSKYSTYVGTNHSMGWYNILLVLLMLSSIFNVIMSYLVFGGTLGNGAASIFFGIMLLLDAAFRLYTRYKLNNYKKDGPLFLYLLICLDFFLGLLFMFGSTSTIITNFLTDIVLSGVFLYLNIRYFEKRKDLFIN